MIRSRHASQVSTPSMIWCVPFGRRLRQTPGFAWHVGGDFRFPAEAVGWGAAAGGGGAAATGAAGAAGAAAAAAASPPEALAAPGPSEDPPNGAALGGGAAAKPAPSRESARSLTSVMTGRVSAGGGGRGRDESGGGDLGGGGGLLGLPTLMKALPSSDAAAAAATGSEGCEGFGRRSFHLTNCFEGGRRSHRSGTLWEDGDGDSEGLQSEDVPALSYDRLSSRARRGDGDGPGGKEDLPRVGLQPSSGASGTSTAAGESHTGGQAGATASASALLM